MILHREPYLKLKEEANSEDTKIPTEKKELGPGAEDIYASMKENPAEHNDEEDYYIDPVFNKVCTEFFNLKDRKTARYLTHINEAKQNTVVMSLTNKLYDKIVEKCDEIDYGEIPATKGDVTKLSNYNSMKETIAIMHDLLKEYKQDPSPVDELAVALSNLEARREVFERAFRYNVELPIAIYNNVVLGVITGTSYMIATCIEFIKDPGTQNFRISLDKVAYSKSKDHLIYQSLKGFNKACANRDFDKSMDAVLKSSTKNFAGAAGVTAGALTVGIIAGILLIIPVLRELIFLFYYLRVKVSDFFDIQADLLQMNAYNLEASSTLDEEQKKLVMARQLEKVEKFRKISNKFAFEMKKAEAAVDKEKRSNDETKLMTIDDLNDLDMDSGASGSALF